MFKEFIKRIHDNSKIILKITLTLMELTCVLLIIIYSVMLIGALNAKQLYSYRDLGINKYFLVVVISTVIFFMGPALIKKILGWIDEQVKESNFQSMKSDFLAFIAGKTTISIDQLSTDYDVSPQKIKDYLFELMERGILRGVLEKTIQGAEYFDIQEGFTVNSPHEFKLEFFRREIKNFLVSYKTVSIEKIASHFGLSPEHVEQLLKEKIRDQEIAGYIEENTYYCDWPDFLKEMSSVFKVTWGRCPHCLEKTDINAEFCSHCGKKTIPDKISMDEPKNPGVKRN